MLTKDASARRSESHQPISVRDSADPFPRSSQDPGPNFSPGYRIPSLRPRSIAWVRLETDSFSKMLLTCFLTVCSEMKR